MADPMHLRTTPLHDWHIGQNANMAEFGGYQMPLWYGSGVKHEHCSVVTGAGLFDTSHMAVLTVTGTGSSELLQHCFSRDLQRCIGRVAGPLVEGRCVYGLFLREDGSVLDDAIISLLGEECYMVVVNSSMGPVVSDHLLSWAGDSVEITDYTDRLGKIDLQGPESANILASVLQDPDSVFNGLKYFEFRGDIFQTGRDTVHLQDGTSVLVSRTGYTGEFGFELYVQAESAQGLWEQLLLAGRQAEIATCGLAARDSLRTGALLPLSHQDIGHWVFGNTPWSFVLPWNEAGNGFSKQFVGAEAVSRPGADYTYGFAGFDPRKIPVTEETVVVDASGAVIGEVLTCTTDMAIGRLDERVISIATPESAGRPPGFQARGLSCGFVRTNKVCTIGERVTLSAGKRSVSVEIRDDIRPNRTARRPLQEMIRH